MFRLRGEQKNTTEAMQHKCKEDFKWNYKGRLDELTYNKYAKLMCDGNLWKKSRKYGRKHLEYISADLRNYLDLLSKNPTTKRNADMDALNEYMNIKDAQDVQTAEEDARDEKLKLEADKRVLQNKHHNYDDDMGGSRRRRKRRSRRSRRRL
jgi:hypothetical protein